MKNTVLLNDNHELYLKRFTCILIIAAIIAVCVTLTALSVISSKEIVLIGIVGVFLILTFFTSNSYTAIYLNILLLPLITITVIDTPLLGISGLKLPILLQVFGCMYIIAMEKSEKLEPKQGLLLFGYFVFFTISTLRCYPYLINVLKNKGENCSLFQFINTHYLRQLLLFWLVFCIAVYVKDRIKLEEVVKVLLLQGVIASCVILYAISSVRGIDFEEYRTAIQNLVNIHPSYIQNFIMIVIPLTLCCGIKLKWKWCYIILALEVGSSLYIFSRAAYVSIIVVIVVTLLLLRQYRLLIGGVICSPIIILCLPNIVLERMLTGTQTNNIQELSSGRVTEIWLPLLEELRGNIGFFLFGNGRYGIYNTDVYKTGTIYQVNNAHNIILDSICDIGVVGLVFFVVFYGYFIFCFIKRSGQVKEELFQCVLLSCSLGIFSYFVKGFAEGVIWAENSNVMMFILIGVGIACCNISSREDIQCEKA